MPKVSFILPAYKRRFLREAIASILSQGSSSHGRSFRSAHSLSCSDGPLEDFELVVVDDCSPEDLKSVVDEFHDERLTYHRNETNIGGKDLVAAWNHAMEYARGEWCVLASDDDVYLPWFLDEMMKLVEKYPSCDLFHARNADIDSEGKWTAVAFPRPEFETQLEMAYARSVLRLSQRMPDFMFRRSALERVGGFVKFPLAWYSDDATWILLSQNGCAHTREVQFCFRNSDENLSSFNDPHVEEKIAGGLAFDRWMEEMAKTMCSDDESGRLMRDELVRKTKANTLNLSLGLVEQVQGVCKWWRCVKAFGGSPAFVRERIYKRFPRLLALRLLLPHWR